MNWTHWFFISQESHINAGSCVQLSGLLFFFSPHHSFRNNGYWEAYDSIDGKAMKAVHHGMCHPLKLAWRSVDVIWQSLSSIAPANRGIPSEMSNQIICVEKWQQQPICHIFSMWHLTSFSLIHSSPSQKNNKINSLDAVRLIGLILYYCSYCQI